MATLYCDPTATLSGVRGNPARPFASVVDANAAAQAGDTISLVAGSYGVYNTGIDLLDGVNITGPGSTLATLTFLTQSNDEVEPNFISNNLIRPGANCTIRGIKVVGTVPVFPG